LARGSAQNAKGNKANNQPASAKGAGSHLRANKGHEAEFDDFEPLVEPSANRDIAGVVIAVLAIASFIAVISPATAPVTAAVAGFYHLGFGLGAYVLPIVILLFAATLFLGEDSPLNVRSVAGGAVVFIAVVSILSLMVPGTSDSCDLMFTPQNLSASGGYIGAFIASVLQNALGKPIAMVVLLGLAVVGFVIIGFSVGGVLRSARDRAADFAERRRADVNASPWGDDEALSVPGVARPHLSILRQKGSDTAVTTVMGNDADPVLDDDDDDEDGGEATLSEQNLYRRLSEYYDLLEDLDNYVRGCAQNFNGSYLEEDRTTRQNLADVAERTEDTIEQYYDIVEDLDVPTSSKNYSSWKDIIALYDDLDHRIDAICDAWEISLKYAKPADHKNEIVAPLSRDNVAGTNDNKYRLDFEERYPDAKPVEVN
jgi:hypothetical protein